MDKPLERLSKFLAKAGIASRREAESFILEGKIFVNGKKITELGTKIDPTKDKVTVSGKEVREDFKVYYLLNKPKGYTSTLKDPFAKNKVIDLIPNKQRVFPIGRLDKDTEGILLLTNDGDLTFKLTHPKHEKEKEYEVTIKNQIEDSNIRKLENGVRIEGKKTAPAKVKFVRNYKDSFLYSITIKEGRNRQIRKMFAEVGHPVIELKRIRLDFLTLDKLKIGKFRNLTKEEVAKLKK